MEQIVNSIAATGAAILGFHITPDATIAVVDWFRCGVYDHVRISDQDAAKQIVARREIMATICGIELE